ncbi:MAG: hypothetical protein LBN05_00860 [Oscillospiraceae bacterium]|jgi:hypothetical protein|nr:hypothetical protein [Oscillospiraceae bacterium]
MSTMTMKEICARPEEICQKIANNEEVVVTYEGKATGVFFPVLNSDEVEHLATLLRSLRLAQTMKKMQSKSKRAGTDQMSMDEIDAEIAAYRAEKRRSVIQA